MEDEDDYPPPREEEEDLGPEYLSYELHQEVGTVPSRGLLDDLLEASARRYHKNITLILLETRKLSRARLQACCEELNSLIQKNPTWQKKEKQEALDWANVAWEKERAEFERQMRQVMSAEEDVRNKRDTAIRQWVEEKGGGQTAHTL